MLAGRNSLVGTRLADLADQGERWLRTEFDGKGLDFHTGWDTSKGTITLKVYRQTRRVDGNKAVLLDLLFKVTEPADTFISHTTLTKIIMVA